VTARYRFLTTWVLDAPRRDVWAELEAVERWPAWWRGVEVVEKLAPGDERGVGAVYGHRWRSRLPYTVAFEMRTTRVEPPFALEGVARGELEGVGRWRLYEEDGATAVTYEWDVRTTRPWMNAIAPVARPAFRWSHDDVMRRGGECLARRLGVRLLAAS
jgi:hypothetical protein